MTHEENCVRQLITVIGHGTTKAAVDQVELDLGIEILRADAGQAFEAAASVVTRVLVILADAGVDSRGVRTMNLRLGPKTQWVDNAEKLMGYVVGQRLLVTVQGLDGLSRLLTDVATAGLEGVRFDGLAFATSDPSAARARVRELAMLDARIKAGQLAELAGKSLGEVESISEVVDGGGPRPMAGTELMRSAADMPIATGDGDISAALRVVFQIAQRENQ